MVPRLPLPPGTSWPVGLFRPPHTLAPATPADTPPAVPPPLPPLPPAGTPPQPPLVERFPEAGLRREARIADKVALVVNSLISSGQLVQTGPADWAIDAAALSGSGGGGLTADGRTAGHYGA